MSVPSGVAVITSEFVAVIVPPVAGVKYTVPGRIAWRGMDIKKE